jgi:hypothetical protein
MLQRVKVKEVTTDSVNGKRKLLEEFNAGRVGVQQKNVF